MSLSEASESEYVGKDRRHSIRAKALLPFSIKLVAKDEIPELESMILDAAVMDSEQANLGASDWLDQRDDMQREVVFVLKEIRALRQQLTEVKRSVDLMHSAQTLHTRWLVLNDRGLWIPADREDPILEYEEGSFVRVKMQIPSISSPNILALAEVLRVRRDQAKNGVAVEFRSISELHQQAIIRYALKRERELARSRLFSKLNM